VRTQALLPLMTNYIIIPMFSDSETALCLVVHF